MASTQPPFKGHHMPPHDCGGIGHGTPMNFDPNPCSVPVPCRENNLEEEDIQLQKCSSFRPIEKRTGQVIGFENPHNESRDLKPFTDIHGTEHRIPRQRRTGWWLKNGKLSHLGDDIKDTRGRGSSTRVDPCQKLNLDGTQPCHFFSSPASKAGCNQEMLRNQCHTTGANFSPVAPSNQEEQRACDTGLYHNHRWQPSFGNQDITVPSSNAQNFGQDYLGNGRNFKPTIPRHENEDTDEHGNDSKALYNGKDLYQSYLRDVDTAALLNVMNLAPSGVPEWFEQPNIKDYSPIYQHGGQYSYGEHFDIRYNPWADYAVDAMTGLPPLQNSITPTDEPSNELHTFGYMCSPESSFSSQFSNSVASDISPEPDTLKSSVVDGANVSIGISGRNSITKQKPCQANTRQLHSNPSTAETDTYIDDSPVPEKTPRRKGGRLTSQRSEAKDAFLIQCKRSGMSYKEIKMKGHFSEAESTLRGRFRTLTKRKEHRVRKPGWRETDLRLLCEAVMRYAEPPRCISTDEIGSPKVSWKQVGEYIWRNGGSYHFGNATCKKKWAELQGGQSYNQEGYAFGESAWSKKYLGWT